MLVKETVNNNFTHLIQIRIKKDTALLLINEQIAKPIVKTTMVANAKKVRAILKLGLVPEDYKDTPIEDGKSQSYSFKFLLLLLAYVKHTTALRCEGFSPAQISRPDICDEMMKRVDREKLISTFRDKLEVVGKNLPSYFALECIKVSKSTLYTLTKLHPELPPIQWGRTYTPEEIDQWRNFLVNRKYQHHFQKDKEVAL